MHKAILHDHLDGGLRPSTALELAKEVNYSPLLEAADITLFFDRSDSTSLDHYLEAFTHTIALMQTAENLERIAYEAAEDMHNNGITMYESRYAPFYSVNEVLSPTGVLDAINSGFVKAENDFGIKSGLILCGMRHDHENVDLVAELAIDNKEKIIGFDIAGPELNFMPSLFHESFNRVKEVGINITIHAGEGDGVLSIKDALSNGAQRIGHGVRIIEDVNEETGQLGETSKEIIDKQIPLEVCITSNMHTNMYHQVSDHPIKNLIDLGFNISLNTDNRLMSNTSVSKEIQIAESLGIANVEQLLSNSASYSFLD
jgi:adenosine deaminase